MGIDGEAVVQGDWVSGLVSEYMMIPFIKAGRSRFREGGEFYFGHGQLATAALNMQLELGRAI